MVRLGSIRNDQDLDDSFATKAEVQDKANRRDMVFNVRDYRQPGDPADDHTAACQAAIDAAKAIGGGTVFFPAGIYRVMGLTVNASNIQLKGAGMKTSVIRRHPNSPASMPLVDLSGTPPPDANTQIGTHVRNCSIEDLTLHGSDKPGLLLRLYYTDCHLFSRVQFWGATQSVGIECVEFFDSRFMNCRFDYIGKKTTGANAVDYPGFLIANRTSSVVGTMGYSNDNCNQIFWYGCVWESCGGRCLVIDGDSLGTVDLANGFYMESCKFESSFFTGPFITVGRNVSYVFFSKLYLSANHYPAGWTGGPADAIQVNGSGTSWRDIHIAAANGILENPLNAGIHFTGAFNGSHFVDGVIGTYNNVPTASNATILVSSTPANMNVTINNVRANGGVPVINNRPNTFIDYAHKTGDETIAGKKLFSDDMEGKYTTRSPDGSLWRVQVANNGTISAVRV